MPYHVHNLNQMLLPPGAEYPGSIVIGDDGVLTTDYRMKFITPWLPTDTYYPQQTVLVNGWTMAANKQTTDYPAPTTLGDLFNLYTGTSPTTSGTYKQVIFGNRYTNTLSVQLVSYFVYTITGQAYDIYLVRDPEGDQVSTKLLSISAATSTGWAKYNVEPTIIYRGTPFDLLALTTEPADTPVTVDATYNYTTPQNPAAPTDGQIVHSRSNADIMSISYTDDDTTDRTALIQGLSTGDQIEIGGLTWTVQSNSDQTTYANVIVSPNVTGTAGIQTVTFETVTATPIEYMQDTAYWPTTPYNVSGVISIDDTYPNATINTNAYGTDIEIIEVSLSEDWDIVAPGDAGSTGQAVLSRQEKSWVSESSTLFDRFKVTTTDNIWTEFDRLPFTGKAQRGEILAKVKRTDQIDYGVIRAAIQGFWDGASVVADTDVSYRTGPNTNNVRVAADGTDLVFEVRGGNMQTWDWNITVFFVDID